MKCYYNEEKKKEYSGSQTTLLNARFNMFNFLELFHMLWKQETV